MRITEEMTDELNALLASMGCSFKFAFREEMLNNKIDVVPMNSQFIDSCIINLTKECYSFIEHFFKGKGIEELSCNNTGSTIWSKRGFNHNGGLTNEQGKD
ncbi:MAG: hypothetical protein HFH48_02560 [Lachnospiraceae bacterium]|nr:hypothetical protein [Lachnospiraceae bacterium]